MALGWDSLPFSSVFSTRRKLSYLRWSPTARLLAASMFLFLSVCLVLFHHTPSDCAPCDKLPGNHLEARQELATALAPLDQDQQQRAEPKKEKEELLPAVAIADVNNQAERSLPDTAPTKGIKLLSNDEAKKLNLGEKPKATKAAAKPRKFRNPPVPERPVISDEEQAKHKLAVIIPYRDRLDNLKVFVPTVGAILKAQKINYGIYVVEQTEFGAFNRGKLCNIGFTIAREDGYDYIAIHDVDKVPVSANVSYRWPGDTFVHMATCVEQFKWELPYYNFLGGVVMFRMDHYAKFNGMTNIFWGFGAEDDDLWVRIKRARIRISRAHACHMGRFSSLDHGNSSLFYPKVDYLANYNLYRQLLKRKRKMETDGLSTLDYKLLKRRADPLGYTTLTVDVCKGSLGRATVEETGCDGPKARPSEAAKKPGDKAKT